jgi:multisubunit Na+/H+ antiporter MnhF subunit
MILKNALKSIGAVLAGFMVTFALSYGTDAVMAQVGVIPSGPLPMYGSEPVIFMILVYRTVYNVVGAYLVARLAPSYPMRHALVIGALGFLGSIAVAIAAPEMGPAWYAWSIVVTAVPSAWLGGKLFEVRTAKAEIAKQNA